MVRHLAVKHNIRKRDESCGRRQIKSAEFKDEHCDLENEDPVSKQLDNGSSQKPGIVEIKSLFTFVFYTGIPGVK